MILYKVIKNNQSCNGGSFDWTNYLPKEDKPGKWTPRIRDTNLCDTGYHVTPYWNMWHEAGCDVYTVETKGLVKRNDAGVIDKYVCSSVRLLKKLDLEFDEQSNTGDWNAGHGNTGNWNTGESNTGEWNAGSRNTGYGNTGDWNTGYRNVGCFNTGEPRYHELFNQPIEAEAYYAIRWPSWFYFELEDDYQTSWIKAFKEASVEGVQKAIELPNFDYAVFKEITGITKAMISRKLKS